MSLESFMGLQVLPVSPTPADGGKAISDDLRSLVSWNPKSSWNNSRSPTATDDSGDDFYPGSLWSRTDTTPIQLFLCTNSTPTATWVPILAANQTITLTGNVTGSGTTSIATTIGAGVVTNAMLAGSIASGKLASTTVSAGSYGTSSAIPTLTVNAQGQLTAASTAPIAAPASGLTGSSLASGVTASSLTSVGATLCIGGTTANDTVELDGSSPTLRLANGGSTSSYMQIQDTAAGRCRVIKISASGASEIDFDPVPSDGSGASQFRFFRAVNTTGICSFQIDQGNNSANVSAQVSGNTDSFVCALNNAGVPGNFGVGTATPAALFSVGNGSQFQMLNGGTVSKYANVATVARGVPSCVAKVNLTAQSAAITATTIYTAPADGFYRINYIATITTPATTSCTLGGTTGFQVRYANVSDSAIKVTNPTAPVVSSTNAIGTAIADSVVVYAKAGAIQYLMGYTSSGATLMQYDLNIIVEAM